MWTLWRPVPEEMERWGSGWENGVATLPVPRVSGDGDLIVVDRTYAPDDGRERDYRVRIVTGGNLSTARFVFSDDGGLTESPPAPLIPPPIPLSHGITVAFTGTAFYVNDQWAFRGVLPRGPAKTGDLLRATRARSRMDSPTLEVAYPDAVSPQALFVSDWRGLTAVRVVAGTADTGPIMLPASDGARFAVFLAPFNLPPVRAFTFHFQAAVPGQPLEVAEVHLLDHVSDLTQVVPPVEGDPVSDRSDSSALPFGWGWKFAFSGIPDAEWEALLKEAEAWAVLGAKGAAFVVTRAFTEDQVATGSAFIGRWGLPEKARTADHRAHPFSGAFVLKFTELEGDYR